MSTIVLSGCMGKRELVSAHIVKLSERRIGEKNQIIYISYIPRYLGKVIIYKDGTHEFEKSKEDLFWNKYLEENLSQISIVFKNGFNVSRVASAVEYGEKNLSLAKKNPVRKKPLMPKDSEFMACIIQEIVLGNDTIGLNNIFFSIDDKIGEEYLKNGYYYEQKPKELLNAIVDSPLSIYSIKIEDGNDNWINYPVPHKPECLATTLRPYDVLVENIKEWNQMLEEKSRARAAETP